MGCIAGPRPRKTKFRMTIEDGRPRDGGSKFRVNGCTACVDRVPTRLRENSATLNYVTPHFRAEAELEMAALKEGEVLTVGWVQAVTEMKFVNSYPSGQSSWEIHELNSGESEAVSDADGRQYPWYGVTSECHTIKGPSNASKVRVAMNDNFSPTVSWAVPVGREQPDTLERVCRDQSFIAWLVVKNEISGEVTALRAYRWRALVNIEVDCFRAVGARARLAKPYLLEQPVELHDPRLPPSALAAPRANEAQKFVWRTVESELIFEVSCSPALAPTLQPSAVSELRYPCCYPPH